MDKINKIVLPKLRGFVATESIFAMVIIMLCFGIATTTLHTITQSDRNNKRIAGRIAVHQLINTTKTVNYAADTSYTINNIIIIRKHKLRDDIVNAIEYEFTVKDGTNSIMDVYYILKYVSHEN